jgi:hypothetical protein
MLLCLSRRLARTASTPRMSLYRLSSQIAEGDFTD